MQCVLCGSLKSRHKAAGLMQLLNHSASNFVPAVRFSSSAPAGQQAASCCSRFALPPVLLSSEAQSPASFTTSLKLQGKSCCCLSSGHSGSRPASVFADFLYGAVPSQRAFSAPSVPASAVHRPCHRASLSNFEKQDNLAKALLHPRPDRAAPGPITMNGGQPDYTSPDRHHFLAPAASDAAPHWSGR